MTQCSEYAHEVLNWIRTNAMHQTLQVKTMHNRTHRQHATPYRPIPWTQQHASENNNMTWGAEENRLLGCYVVSTHKVTENSEDSHACIFLNRLILKIKAIGSSETSLIISYLQQSNITEDLIFLTRTS